ncbi:MAG TPA: rhodanese-like domain-containing protein [Opitutaceae bacterium]|nr:rhodanese-like domain-containing protein [Opitutaceae bacterium]
MSLLHQLFSLFTALGAGGVRHVPPVEAARLVREKKAVLVDIREPAEWAHGVARNAALLPLSDLNGPRRLWQPFLQQLGGREIIVYCHSGSRCRLAGRILCAEGFTAASAGTLRAWGRAGLPVCKPKPLR